MPRPRTLTRTAIAQAALAVIDREGLETLSIREVAAEMGVGAMTLYRYVKGRDDIEALVVETVLGSMDPSLPRKTGWRSRVSLLMQRARQAMRSHPGVVPLLLTRRHANEVSVAWGEAMLAALAAGGFEGTDRVIAFRTLLSYLTGALQVERFGPLAGAGTQILARLPPQRYPNLSKTAQDAQSVAPDEEFRRGLDVVLRGLAGLTRARKARARRL